MADTPTTSTNRLAVCLKECILALSKRVVYRSTFHPVSIISVDYTISIYNLWTEEWRTHAIPNEQELPEVAGQTAVVIRTNVYFLEALKKVTYGN